MSILDLQKFVGVVMLAVGFLLAGAGSVVEFWPGVWHYMQSYIPHILIGNQGLAMVGGTLLAVVGYKVMPLN